MATPSASSSCSHRLEREPSESEARAHSSNDLIGQRPPGAACRHAYRATACAARSSPASMERDAVMGSYEEPVRSPRPAATRPAPSNCLSRLRGHPPHDGDRCVLPRRVRGWSRPLDVVLNGPTATVFETVTDLVLLDLASEWMTRAGGLADRPPWSAAERRGLWWPGCPSKSASRS